MKQNIVLNLSYLNLGIRKIIPAIIILISMLYVAPALAATKWQLRKDEEGIKVYSASTETSEFKMIKVECIVEATPAILVAILKDIDKKHEWVYSSKESEVLQINNPNDFVMYSQVSVPWPFLDRDYIAHLVFKQVSPGFMTVDVYSEPDKVPARNGIVRVKNHSAHWDVYTIDATKIKVVYTVTFDPGGAVPAWLSNLFVVKAPFETFQTLRNKVTQPKYRNASMALSSL